MSGNIKTFQNKLHLRGLWINSYSEEFAAGTVGAWGNVYYLKNNSPLYVTEKNILHITSEEKNENKNTYIF